MCLPYVSYICLSRTYILPFNGVLCTHASHTNSWNSGWIAAFGIAVNVLLTIHVKYDVVCI